MATCLFTGTVTELCDLARSTESFTNLIRSYVGFAASDDSSEERSWRSSVPALVETLRDGGFGDWPIVLEFPMPGEGRCDAILIGRRHGKNFAHVIECKQWSASRIQITETGRASVKVGGEYKPHPSYQAASYVGKLQSFLSTRDQFSFSSSCFLHNCSGTELDATLRSAPYSDLICSSPVWGHDEREDWHDFIRRSIGEEPADNDSVDALLEGYFEPAPDLLATLAQRGPEISDGFATSLLGSGWGLTPAQQKAEEDILAMLGLGQKRIILVEGSAGSGKTFLACRLLLELLNRKLRAALITPNGRLKPVLQSCLSHAHPSASNLIWNAVGASSKRPLDVAIYDEGQRVLRDDLSGIPQLARLSIIFHDPSQVLLHKEGWSTNDIRTVCRKSGSHFNQYHLPSTLRCAGGEAYARDLRRVIRAGAPGPIASPPEWLARYPLRLFPSVAALRAGLARFREATGGDVALVASFTESDGTTEKLRCRDPQLYWAMSGEDYVRFWTGGSNELTHCASIYGALSFERDLVGVIWGRDLAIRNGSWCVPEDNTITDAIGAPTLLHLVNDRGRPDEAVRLLINRYLIFLSRGKRGTFLTLEDEETAHYFRKLYPWMIQVEPCSQSFSIK